jgi:hypothetical protein
MLILSVPMSRISCRNLQGVRTALEREKSSFSPKFVCSRVDTNSLAMLTLSVFIALIILFARRWPGRHAGSTEIGSTVVSSGRQVRLRGSLI